MKLPKLLTLLLLVLLLTPSLPLAQRGIWDGHTLHKKPGSHLQEGKKININTASAERLQELPHIDSQLAQRIVKYRQKHGPFQKMEDLLEVQGINREILESLKPFITLGEGEKQ